MINKYLSEKLKIVSFYLIILVVYIHSYNLVVNIGVDSKTIEFGYNSYLQYFISYGISRVAVPLFFIISGFLFFVKNKEFTFKLYISKIKKRAKTLLVPYLFWSIMGIGLYFVLQIVPFSKPFFTRQLIADYSFLDFLQRIFFNPIPYQFWFIRDLMVFVFLSPIIYYGLKINKKLLLGILFLVWLTEFDFVIVSNESLFFFTIGSYVAIFNKSKSIITYKHLFVISTTLWILLLAMKTYFYFSALEFNLFVTFLHKASIIIGIISVWTMYDSLNTYVNRYTCIFNDMFRYTFIIFALHEPILTIYKKYFYFLIGQTELSSFLIYILTPLITILTSIIIGSIISKISPKFYKMITGDR